ncbi:alpha/beta hydrolase [Methyloprofundus sedimenti]|uniref:Alpha/beta hydrolase n=1 Tax=Methyloprofundus sedimenti TaxID=1420851 RepID=A0A1V8M447_9GAMM|nr:hydrolase [Methyloprofundus sedimenti]OQK16347.1 alpha/beta hydrolase [Methyloprofundus sedimenti]
MLIQSTFKPAWWLNNAHLQTLYPALFRKLPNSLLKRERLITADDDFIDIDFCGEGDQPLVILLHGLTGSSQSIYIKGLQQALLAQGLRSAALNFRGCSGEYNHSSRCYHSGETGDIDFLYRTLRAREPDLPMAAVGFSLGGNVLLKWLGEQGSGVQLFAATAVSVPLVLSACASKLDSGFSKLYRASLLRELKEYVHLKQQHLESLGKTEEAKILRQVGDLDKITSFWQYDDRVIAKLYDFANVEDYYQRSSSRQFLQSIRIPTLLIQAQDDPFMTPAVIPDITELSSCVFLETTPAGGHVGFISGHNPFRPEYWLEQRIPEFLLEQLSHV